MRGSNPNVITSKAFGVVRDVPDPLSVSRSRVSGKRLILPNRCSTRDHEVPHVLAIDAFGGGDLACVA
jgi:hypothetical protein